MAGSAQSDAEDLAGLKARAAALEASQTTVLDQTQTLLATVNESLEALVVTGLQR